MFKPIYTKILSNNLGKYQNVDQMVKSFLENQDTFMQEYCHYKRGQLHEATKNMVNAEIIMKHLGIDQQILE